MTETETETHAHAWAAKGRLKDVAILLRDAEFVPVDEIHHYIKPPALEEKKEISELAAGQEASVSPPVKTAEPVAEEGEDLHRYPVGSMIFELPVGTSVNTVKHLLDHHCHTGGFHIATPGSPTTVAPDDAVLQHVAYHKGHALADNPYLREHHKRQRNEEQVVVTKEVPYSLIANAEDIAALKSELIPFCNKLIHGHGR